MICNPDTKISNLSHIGKSGWTHYSSLKRTFYHKISSPRVCIKPQMIKSLQSSNRITIWHLWSSQKWARHNSQIIVCKRRPEKTIITLGKQSKIHRNNLHTINITPTTPHSTASATQWVSRVPYPWWVWIQWLRRSYLSWLAIHTISYHPSKSSWLRVAYNTWSNWILKLRWPWSTWTVPTPYSRSKTTTCLSLRSNLVNPWISVSFSKEWTFSVSHSWSTLATDTYYLGS